MGKLNDIKQKLLSGSTPSQLVKEGYAKIIGKPCGQEAKESRTSGYSHAVS